MATSDLTKCYSKDNLIRAWRWINSNPSSLYKNYFRDLYAAYALSFEDNISDLANRLKNNAYFTCTPSMVYIPKSGYITRPFTLLTIEDQIVYQAFINILAEQHIKIAKRYYYVSTFGNLYAGKSSSYFYRKWIKGYNEYNRAIKSVFKEGYDYIASFDLTACYDTIDHKILLSFLDSYKLDKEFSNQLIDNLSNWSTNQIYYKGHGIPQGPISSGLLSEIILFQFDQDYDKRKRTHNVKYFRYVDDIRLLARDPHSLKIMLARLDYICKQIGLFPQASKIEIHKINDIEEEIKNLSVINNELFNLQINKSKKEIETTFVHIIKNNKVQNVTKFKMFLSKTHVNAKISNKLLELLQDNPQLVEPIAHYFQRYPRKISDKIVNSLFRELVKPEIYQFVNAQLLLAIKDKLSIPNQERLKKYILTRWKTREKNKINPIFRSVLISYLLENSLLNYKETSEILSSETDWWVLKTILKHINIEHIGEPSYCTLMDTMLKHKCVDVALSAAHEIVKNNCQINSPYTGINHIAQKLLKFSGIIPRAASRPSIIADCLGFICKKKLPVANWKKIFGNDHNAAERMIVRAYGYAQNDMSAFVNILDSFNDLLLSKLFAHDSNLPTYNLGHIGSAVNNRNTRLERFYPKLFYLCKEIHAKRLDCDLSHPLTRSTHEFTKPIEYKYIFKARKIIYDAYFELLQKW